MSDVFNDVHGSFFPTVLNREIIIPLSVLADLEESVVPWSAPVCPLEDVQDQLDASAGGGR